MEDRACYVLWSGKHRAWWLPAAMGYTDDRKRAGLYTHDEAVEHVTRSARSGGPGAGHADGPRFF